MLSRFQGPSAEEIVPFSTISCSRFRTFVGQFFTFVVSGEPWPRFAQRWAVAALWPHFAAWSMT